MAEQKSKNYYSNVREEMAGFIPKSVNILLEVGCGSADFAEFLKSIRPMEIWGVELFSDAVAIARRKIDKVIEGNIEDINLSLPPQHFDCIVFNDVLEHLIDPWSVLTRLRGNLKVGGYVVASIPNMRHYVVMKELLISKTWQYAAEGVLDRTHLRFFTKQTMIDMFKDSGYRIVQCVGIHGEKFPFKLGLLNRILLNALDDMRFKQFACVAQKL